MEDLQQLFLSLASKSFFYECSGNPALTCGTSQPFWANMVASAGAGPPPLAIATLTANNLVEAIQMLLAPATLEAAAVISQKMQQENGVKEAVNSFHRNLPLKKLNCDFIPNQPAVWAYKKDKRVFKFSHEAAKTLIESGRVEEKDLKW